MLAAQSQESQPDPSAQDRNRLLLTDDRPWPSSGALEGDAGIRTIIIPAILYLGSAPLASSAVRIAIKSLPVLSTRDFWDPRA